MSRASVYSFPPTPQDWSQIQDVVRSYYVNQKMPLKEVRAALRDLHGFRATERMIKARLKQWGYLKNAKKEDWHFLALIHQNRRMQGKTSTVFDVRGHSKTVKDLHRFIRNQGMSTEEFLNEARERIGNKQIPGYIRAMSPDTSSRVSQGSPSDEVSPGYLTPSPPPPPPAQLHQSRPSFTESTNSQFLSPLQPTNHQRIRSTSSSSNGINGAIFSSMNQHLQPYPTTTYDPHDPRYPSTGSSEASSCQQIQWEFETCASQITRPAPLSSRLGDDDIRSWALLTKTPSSSEQDSSGSSNNGQHSPSVEYVCSRCNQPSNQHFVGLDSFEPHQQNPHPQQHQRSQQQRDILNGDNHTLHLPVSTKEEGSWTWVSRCFLACICLTKGDRSAADACLNEAAKEFERLLEKKDRLLLTAAGLVMTVLHMHDQGQVAKTVMESANRVAQATLPSQHPVTVTIGYLTASASLSLDQSGITSDTLKNVYGNFLQYYPPNHEYCITSRYNYAWMLKHENRLEEAEREARIVYDLSCEVLGELHMQSITALAVVAGCLFPGDDRAQECIALYEQVVEKAAMLLGVNYPYTLEAKRRLALKLRDVNGGQATARTLQLFKDVLWGRMRMLGSLHGFTHGAREDYENDLKALGLWVDGQGEATVQQKEVSALFGPNSPDSWTKVHVAKKRGDNGTAGVNVNRLSMRSDMSDYDMLDEEEDGEEEDDDGDDVVVHDAASPTSSNEYEAY